MVAVNEPGGIKAAHETRMKAMGGDAFALAGAATRLANQIEQTLVEGGVLNAQAQMAFLTGAVARMQKDWGVIEHLQQYGSVRRRKGTQR